MPEYEGGTEVLGPIVPPLNSDTYPTHLSQFGKGGLHHCATLADRDLIEDERKEHGMLAFVKANETYYKLESNLITWTAVSLTGGGGGGSDYVNNLAALMAIPTVDGTGVIKVLGETTPGDGFGWDAFWAAGATDAHNPPLFTRPNDYTSGGGWRQW